MFRTLDWSIHFLRRSGLTPHRLWPRLARENHERPNPVTKLIPSPLREFRPLKPRKRVSRTALSRETAGDPSRKTPSELRQEQLAPTYLWMTTLEQLNLLPAPLEHLHYLFPCQGPSTNQGASPARLG